MGMTMTLRQVLHRIGVPAVAAILAMAALAAPALGDGGGGGGDKKPLAAKRAPTVAFAEVGRAADEAVDLAKQAQAAAVAWKQAREAGNAEEADRQFKKARLLHDRSRDALERAKNAAATDPIESNSNRWLVEILGGDKWTPTESKNASAAIIDARAEVARAKQEVEATERLLRP